MNLARTKRGVIDPLRKCHLRCDFCYYLHGDMESIRPLESVQKDIETAAKRGDTHLDITGGEPLSYGYITNVVSYALSLGLKSRIISSLIVNPRIIDQVVQAGLDDWLISTHGMASHDSIVHINNARAIQEKRLEQILGYSVFDRGICFNYVMVQKNQTEILDYANYILRWRPRVVNFINFNPHYEWLKHQDRENLVVDLSIVGPQLDDAIRLLEDNNVGVNVRYFPMCALDERSRKNVCNDLHVAFDSGEWSNGIGDNSYQGAYNYGVNLSNAIEEKGAPCCSCSLQWTCGGANKAWHQANKEKYGEQLVPLKVTSLGFDHYRKHNRLGMA